MPEPLETSRAVFDSTVARARRLRERGDLLPAAVWAQIAAHFATYRHNGLYTSADLESLLLDIAEALPDAPGSPAELPAGEKRPPRRRILHVLTRALPIGGHTRVVERWARNDTASTHSLVATAQTDPLPSWLEEAIAESGGFFETLAGSSADLLSRALRLRGLAGAWADVVVLHAHPYDVVPPIAFGVDGGPPVVLFNHSDATFWLGSRTADVVADIREGGRRHSLQRRGVRSSMSLPVPVVAPPGGLSREAAKKHLGIAATATVLFTAGEDFKFVPRGEHDFFRTAGRILARRSDAVLLAAGSSDPKRWRSDADKFAPGRFRFHGPEEKIGLLQAAADIYLDPFPAASLTVALETAARGIPIVGLRQPANPLFSSSDDPAFEAGPGHVGSLEDYERRADALIGNPRMRAREGREAARAVAAFHMPPGWNAALERLLDALPSRHTVSPQAPAPDAPGEADLFLAEFEASGAPDFDLRSCIAASSRYLNNWDRAGLLLKALRGGERAPLLPFRSYLPELCLVLGKRVLRRVSSLTGRRSL